MPGSRKGWSIEVGDGFDPENATESVRSYEDIPFFLNQLLLASKLIRCLKIPPTCHLTKVHRKMVLPTPKKSEYQIVLSGAG